MNRKTEALVSITQTMIRYNLGEGVPVPLAIEAAVSLVDFSLKFGASANERILATVELQRRMIPQVTAKAWPYYELSAQ